MKISNILASLLVASLTLFLASVSEVALAGDHHKQEQQEEVEKGVNNGRMLRDGDFAIELSLFEQGLAPEYRVYATMAEKMLPAAEVDVSIKLTRLGGVVDDINFSNEGNYLRGDMEIYEPHSFVVDLTASYQGKKYHWSYESFEGRTFIQDAMAKSMNIETEIVSSQELQETITVYGQLALPKSAIRHIRARFPGEIISLNVALGDKVSKGQNLMVVESNESLQRYTIKAPLSGVITFQEAGVGEQTGEQTLLTITDNSKLTAELSVFPMEQGKVTVGDKVNMTVAGSDVLYSAKIKDALVSVNNQQAKIFRADIDNASGRLQVGQFIRAKIIVDTYTVPLAVKSAGLQSFRDFTVVFAKVGQEYEVRMLNLGRASGPWREVLSGIKEGTEYVTENSYIIKADIDKSGAAHDH
ncbi:efflux RND transporter periplasmic adaptor subunit [Litorilituus lipolyticus]|uniref:HlyD family efflux transporter periplasmic adaptor subunit n=1 Tax=Litorilituus lipolyticus TaxID=2491017 RepID=A0A502LAI5_9GAMM|nr:efflux RND transporter periplasmic adaptor subunit [Litorilituus lipolyticus]TPH19281.1 HlyD family efflux transporter periplasmic adaptor subunit [Litorilituus lipolyticus]